MAQRSTRNKIRWQARKMIDHTERCLQHCKAMDELSQGAHPTVAKYLPNLVLFFTETVVTLNRFRDEL